MNPPNNLYIHRNLITYLNSLFPDPNNFSNLATLSHHELTYKLGQRQAFLRINELFNIQEDQTANRDQPIPSAQHIEDTQEEPSDQQKYINKLAKKFISS